MSCKIGLKYCVITAMLIGIILCSIHSTSAAVNNTLKNQMLPYVDVRYDFVNGTIDELRIFNRTLTSAEINESYISSPQAGGEIWNCTINATDALLNAGLLNSTTRGISTMFPIVNYEPLNRTNTSSNTPSFIYNYTHVSGTAGTCSLIVDGVVKKTDAGVVSGVNSTIVPSSAIGEGVLQNWSISCTESSETDISIPFRIGIDTVSPSISLSQPTGEYFTYSTPYTVPINFTFTELNKDSCWYQLNGTNFSLALCNNLTTTINNNLNTTIITYINDSVGHESSSSNGFSINLLNASSNAIPGNVTEGNSVIFTLQINSTNITFINASLNYNNSYYGYDSIENNYTQANVTISLVIPVGNGTIPYFWNYTVNSFNNLTDKKNITVGSGILVVASTCPTGLSAAYNITFKNELNQTNMTESIKYNFQYGFINNTQFSSYGEIIGISEFQICINSSITNNYTLSYGEIEYYVNNFATRKYYLFKNQSLTNNTNNLTLYSLQNSYATSFQFITKDNLLNPYIGYYLALLRWYPENNTYKVVEMAKTNELGQTVMRVQVEDADYRVALYQTNGLLVKLADPTKMVCLEAPCTFTFTVNSGNADYTSLYGIQGSIIFNSSNNMLTYSFNDPSQRTTEMTLYVYKDNGYTKTTICNNTLNAYIGILTCNVTGNTGLIVAHAYRSASPANIVASWIHEFRQIIARQIGLFGQFVISILIAFVATWNPIAAIFLTIIGLIYSLAFGLMSVQVIIAAGLIGGIIIHFIGRSHGK